MPRATGRRGVSLLRSASSGEAPAPLDGGGRAAHPSGMTTSRPEIAIATSAGVLRVVLSFDRPAARRDLSGGADRPQAGAAEPVATVHFEGLALHRVAWSGWVEVKLGGAPAAGLSNLNRVDRRPSDYDQRDRVERRIVAEVAARLEEILFGDLARETRAYERARAVEAAEAEVAQARERLARAEAKLAAALAA